MGSVSGIEQKQNDCEDSKQLQQIEETMNNKLIKDQNGGPKYDPEYHIDKLDADMEKCLKEEHNRSELEKLLEQEAQILGKDISRAPQNDHNSRFDHHNVEEQYVQEFNIDP